MRLPGRSRVILLLGLILLLGTLARVPGLFWGYRLFGSEVVALHPDEPPYTLGRGPDTGFPRGLEVQVRLLTSGLNAVGLGAVAGWPHYDFFVGRVVSLVYGALTIVVLFRLGRTLFDAETALLAAFFLALADLHVTYSHIGVPDAAATFWYYAALAAAATALARQSRPAALLSAVATGAVGAMRFQLTSVVPLVWWLGRSRTPVRDALGLGVGLGLSFFAFNGFGFNYRATQHILTFIVEWGDLGARKLALPLVYFAVLLVGVGLPVFLLAAFGGLRLARELARALRSWRAVLADDRLAIVMAVLTAFLQICTVGLWAHRHAVVLVPFVALLAARGVRELPRWRLASLSAAATARALLVLIGLYLAVHVASVQAYFVDDPLEKAGRWLRARVPAGEAVSGSAIVPREYPRLNEWKANFLVLTAQEYRRYLFTNFLPVRLTGRMATAGDFAAGRVWGGRARDAEQFARLFRGELPYRLVKRVRLRFYTPELLLTEAFWYPPPHLNEVLIYERRRERERRLALITPSRTDYLVTVDTGKLWRPDPDQRIDLSLNGRPLAGTLREGDNHLFVPRSLVTSPHSELRLGSAGALPHLPPGVLKRVRLLGSEVVVDALLDGDLMTEGFYGPEIRSDGATFRWTQAVARIVLPGPGAGGAWRRLAVRLRGRPGDGPPQPVVFFLNGRKVGEAEVSEADRTVELPIPEGLLVAGLGVLELVTSPWRPAELVGSGDSRVLGVAVYWVRLSRAERFRPPADAIETVSFPSDGLRVRADLFAPRNAGRSAILLAHGGSPKGRRHGLYLGLARRLAERGYWVLSPDFRGYGESDAPPRIASPGDLDFSQDLVAAVSFLRTRLEVRDVTLVGHSFGAGVALAHAARDPGVGRVVAISPGRRVYERMLGSAEGRQALRDRMVAEMGLRSEQFPIELVESVVVPIIIDTYVEHPFRQPVLLVDGEREDEADLAFLRDVARRMKADTTYITLPRADHYFGIERQVEERDPVTLGLLADVIDGWIREGRRWSASRP